MSFKNANDKFEHKIENLQYCNELNSNLDSFKSKINEKDKEIHSLIKKLDELKNHVQVFIFKLL